MSTFLCEMINDILMLTERNKKSTTNEDDEEEEEMRRWNCGDDDGDERVVRESIWFFSFHFLFFAWFAWQKLLSTHEFFYIFRGNREHSTRAIIAKVKQRHFAMCSFTFSSLLFDTVVSPKTLKPFCHIASIIGEAYKAFKRIRMTNRRRSNRK